MAQPMRAAVLVRGLSATAAVVSVTEN